MADRDWADDRIDALRRAFPYRIDGDLGEAFRAELRQARAEGRREMRDARQTEVANWCAAAFGTDQAASVEQRGLRLAEEAIEAAQAAGCNPDQLHKLIGYIYARPVGTMARELGGVGITTLALAQAAGVSADQAEADELARVLSKPLEHFTARNQAKNDAGFRALAQQDGQ